MTKPSRVPVICCCLFFRGACAERRNLGAAFCVRAHVLWCSLFCLFLTVSALVFFFVRPRLTDFPHCVMMINRALLFAVDFVISDGKGGEEGRKQIFGENFNFSAMPSLLEGRASKTGRQNGADSAVSSYFRSVPFGGFAYTPLLCEEQYSVGYHNCCPARLSLFMKEGDIVLARLINAVAIPWHRSVSATSLLLMQVFYVCFFTSDG